jgi:ubiquinone/menaquinone biosynthesis C-methylase UbiE
MRNHFDAPWVGPRYAAARPDVHGVIAREIASQTGRISRAVDLGTGTGLSSRSLLPYCERVVGLDPAAGMLRAAAPAPALSYVRGRAEFLPFRTGSIQLVSIGCAYHWCDPEQLFTEANRVLSKSGWLAIFDSEFMGLVEAPSLLEWLRENYWQQLPRCPRNPLFDPDAHLRQPFSVVRCSSPEIQVPMTADAICMLITTQASTVNAVTQGGALLKVLEAELHEGVRSHFPDAETATARFVNPLWLLRKHARPAV